MAINDNRYIGSSEALKIQQDATGQVGAKALTEIAEMRETSNQFFSSLVETNKNISNLQSTYYSQIAQNRSKPSALEEVGKGAVKAYADVYKQQKKDKEKEQKSKQELDRNKLFIETDKAIGGIVQKYESDNWASGIQGFNKEVAETLAKVEAGIKDPEVAKYVLSKLDESQKLAAARAKQVTTRVQEEQDKLTDATAAKEEASLTLSLSSLLSALGQSGRNDDTTKIMEDVNKAIAGWYGDSKLPETQKTTIIARTIKAVAESNSTRASRAFGLERGLSNINQAWAAKAEVEARYNASQKTPDDLARYNQEIDRLTLTFPEVGEANFRKMTSVSLGEFKNTLLGIANTQQELRDKQVGRAVSNLSLSQQEITAIAAGLYLDSSGSAIQALAPLKDTPAYTAALDLVETFKEYNKDYTAFNSKLAALREKQASFYSTIERAKLGDFKRIQAANAAGDLSKLSPEQQQIAALKQAIDPDADLSKLSPQQLQEYYTGLRQTYDTQLKQELETIEFERSRLGDKYARLTRLGISAPGDINRLANTLKPTLDGLNQRVFQIQQQSFSQPEQTEVYGNFNTSSKDVPILDDNGKLLALYPRARLATSKARDGSVVIAPFVGISKAPLSNNGEYLNDRGTHRHAGQDYAVGINTQAVALVSGSVVHTGYNKGGYGGFIDVLGDNGFVYRYAHVAPQFKQGQRVKPGDVVALINGSGSGTGAHLHFEVHQNPTYVNGKYTPAFKTSKTVDPVEHMKLLGASNKTVLSPRVNLHLLRQRPDKAVPSNSVVGEQGKVFHNGYVQQLGSQLPPMPISSVQSVQKPYRQPIQSGWLPSSVSNNPSSNLGYKVLSRDNRLRAAMHQTANNLGVPAEWIADIAAQESGGIQPNYRHPNSSSVPNPNGNYGLFGFGSDSFADKSIHARLVRGEIDGAGQVQLLEKYMKENGWGRLVKERNGKVSIADFWAFIKFGTTARRLFHRTHNINMSGYTSRGAYKNELELLGKWVGRRYLFDDRRSRLQPVSDQPVATCRICSQMAESGSFVPHAHDSLQDIA